MKRSIEGNNKFGVIASGLTSVSHRDCSATPGKTYLYKVSAVNSNGEGGDSEATSILLPKAPSLHQVVH